MRSGTAIALGAAAAMGLACVAAALLSLRPGSRLRRGYGIDPEDDAGVRSNAAVVGASGIGLLALAAGVAAGVSERAIGTAAVLLGAGACVVLGWLVRYRDRRELLTTPDADREAAERLGASAIVCGLLALPLAPAIWVGASDALVGALALGGAFGSFFAVAYAHR